MRSIFKISLLFMLFYSTSWAQTISKEQLIFYTSEWKGERFDDGRPKIPDDLVERAKHIGIEEAWTVLRNEGYNNQFESNWKLVNDEVSARFTTVAWGPGTRTPTRL